MKYTIKVETWAKYTVTVTVEGQPTERKAREVALIKGHHAMQNGIGICTKNKTTILKRED